MKPSPSTLHPNVTDVVASINAFIAGTSRVADLQAGIVMQLIIKAEAYLFQISEIPQQVSVFQLTDEALEGAGISRAKAAIYVERNWNGRLENAKKDKRIQALVTGHGGVLVNRR
jgi:hypothetical protein